MFHLRVVVEQATLRKGKRLYALGCAGTVQIVQRDHSGNGANDESL